MILNTFQNCKTFDYLKVCHVEIWPVLPQLYVCVYVMCNSFTVITMLNTSVHELPSDSLFFVN